MPAHPPDLSPQERRQALVRLLAAALVQLRQRRLSLDEPR